MKKILVTGSTGFVGSRFVNRWGGVYRLFCPSHAELDITDAASAVACVQSVAPDVVLHLAALSNTWHCEQNPDDSLRVNVIGAENMARAAARCGAKFVFFSSDQVYNGNCETGQLGEDLAVAPENVYGRHKLEAERRVSGISPDAVILRATWMYDSDASGLPKHNDFVHNIGEAARERKPIVVPVREFRGITWVRDAVEYLPDAFDLQGGVYNYGAENSVNTYETACCYCEMAGADASVVRPDYDRYPQHERNLSGSQEKIFRASGGRICFPSTIDGLRLFLEIASGRY